MKSLLLSTVPNCYASQKFEEEMNKVSDCFHIHWDNLLFKFGVKNLSIKTLNGVNLEDIDFIIWRSPGDRLTPHLNIIFKKSKYVLNSTAKNFTEFGSYNKFCQHYFFIKNNLPVIPSIIYTGERVPRDVIENYIGFPCIIKGIRGGLGINVGKSDDWSELNEVIKNLKLDAGNFFIQRYFPIQFDYRIIILNGKILGIIRRFNSKEEFRTNIAQGGKTEAVNEVAPEIASLALNVSSALNAEFCGVDILSFNENLYVLECNISCQFEGFEKATKVNVAKQVVDYCVKRSINVK